MKEFVIKIEESDRPLYHRIAEGIRVAIKHGQIMPGDALPSYRNLAESLCVHRNTIKVALEELVAEGWLTANEK